MGGWWVLGFRFKDVAAFPRMFMFLGVLLYPGCCTYLWHCAARGVECEFRVSYACQFSRVASWGDCGFVSF